jgi:tRNA-dihydrouridine synthase 3
MNKPRISTLVFLRAAFLSFSLAMFFASKVAVGLSPHEFQRAIRGKMVLAPLSRGGNLPFRRLCADFGMEVSLSEMVYSRRLIKGDRLERTRLRRSENEATYGVQIAANQMEEGAKAIEMIKEAKADFVDLNCGCPIYEATRRGLGSALLRQPERLEKLVEGMVQSIEKENLNLPLTVKIRLGLNDESINVREVVDRMRTAGASAVTIHARTARQGYKKPADWEMIRQVVQDGQEYVAKGNNHMPIIGNGDILTHYEALRRIDESGVDAVMVGRGALIKPWIFQEFRDQEEWEPSLEDRIAVYYTLTSYMKEYFGSDDLGRKKSWTFLPWHFSFFSRFKSYPKEHFSDASLTSPLIQKRIELAEDASPLEVLLNHRSEATHGLIAAALWDSDSESNAIQRLIRLAESHEFQEIQISKDNDEDKETAELSNIPEGRSSKGKWEKRRARSQKPPRTPEEIIEIRAERAAKKARIEAEQAASVSSSD